jgi:nitrate reductase NapE component
MREVPIPRGAQQRLLARLSEMETADADTDAGPTAVVLAGAPESNGLHSDGEEAGRNGQPLPSTAPLAKPARPIQITGRASRRRFLKRLVPLTACLAVALVGFFGVVWIFTPSFSVEDVSKSLAKVDFESLGTLSNFKGKDASLPSEWERLCGTKAKGLSLAPNVIAVYGFDIPNPRHTGAVRGLIAVIPRARIRKLPKADSLATASSLSEYLESRIGTDSVCVAWQQGDVVCVCLIQGPDSLSTLQSALQQPSA